MAEYSNTVLLAAIAELSDTANKDLRAPLYGATNLFAKHKKDVIVNYDDFNLIQNKSDLQTKQIDYLRRHTESVASARTHSLTLALGDSTRDSLTFVTYARQFGISDGTIRNNRIAAQRFMVNEIRNARLDIGASIETAAVAKLEAGKNTYTKATTGKNLGTWDSTNYVLEVAVASKDDYWNLIGTDMRTLDFTPIFQTVHSHYAGAMINRQIAQGAGNTANLEFQFPDWDMNFSGSVSNLSDYLTTGYAVPERTVALVDWIPGKNRVGMVSHGAWDFTAMPDPFGVFDRMAIACQKVVADGSTYGGAQDAQWLYEVSVDVAFYIPTVTTIGLVQKYGLLSS
jgi:hypothetical protein